MSECKNCKICKYRSLCSLVEEALEDAETRYNKLLFIRDRTEKIDEAAKDYEFYLALDRLLDKFERHIND